MLITGYFFKIAFMLIVTCFISLNAKETENGLITLDDLPKNKSVFLDTFNTPCTTVNSQDTLYSFAKTKSIGYAIYKKDNSDFTLDILSILGKNYGLKIIVEDNPENIDADPDMAKLFQLTIGKIKYFYFYCGGTGLMKSGSFQRIRYYIIFSNTLAPVVMMSGLEYKYAFCDINNDGHLNFIQFVNSNDTTCDYQIKTYSLNNQKFMPIKSKYDGKCLKGPFR